MNMFDDKTEEIDARIGRCELCIHTVIFTDDMKQEMRCKRRLDDNDPFGFKIVEPEQKACDIFKERT